MKSLFILLLSLSLLQNIFTYNAAAAVKYARNWWNKRNPNYHDYSNEGGDCANFVSQCLLAGGFSPSGCAGVWGVGGTLPNVVSLENCLKQKGWNHSTRVPSGGLPAGAVIAFNNGQHAVLCVKGGNNPLVAGHTNDEWMGGSNWGWARNYYWVGKNSGGGDSFSWLPTVSGYNINDYNYGFAGDFGRPVVALKINSGTYSVHEIGGGWLTASDKKTAGRGRAIDAVAIKGGVEYRVHLLNGGWLPPVTGYNFNDEENGYAGILGRTIDAVAIKGKTYATGY